MEHYNVQVSIDVVRQACYDIELTFSIQLKTERNTDGFSAEKINKLLTESYNAVLKKYEFLKELRFLVNSDYCFSTMEYMFQIKCIGICGELIINMSSFDMKRIAELSAFYISHNNNDKTKLI